MTLFVIGGEGRMGVKVTLCLNYPLLFTIILKISIDMCSFSYAKVTYVTHTVVY